MRDQTLIALLWFLPAIWGFHVLVRSRDRTRLARRVEAYRFALAMLCLFGVIWCWLGGKGLVAYRAAEESTVAWYVLVASGLVIAGGAALAIARPTARRAAFVGWSAIVDPVLAIALDQALSSGSVVDGWSQDASALFALTTFAAVLVGTWTCRIAATAFDLATSLPPAQVR